jgi:hypothetical protein
MDQANDRKNLAVLGYMYLGDKIERMVRGK